MVVTALLIALYVAASALEHFAREHGYR